MMAIVRVYHVRVNLVSHVQHLMHCVRNFLLRLNRKFIFAVWRVNAGTAKGKDDTI